MVRACSRILILLEASDPPLINQSDFKMVINFQRKYPAIYYDAIPMAKNLTNIEIMAEQSVAFNKAVKRGMGKIRLRNCGMIKIPRGICKSTITVQRLDQNKIYSCENTSLVCAIANFDEEPTIKELEIVKSLLGI